MLTRSQRWSRVLWALLILVALMATLLVGLHFVAPSFHVFGAANTTPTASPCIGDDCVLGPGVRGVQLFVEPEAGERPITSAIRGAVHSVEVEVYLLTDSAVIGALEDAVRRGVQVRVMLEQHPYGSDVVSPQRTLQALTTAGVTARFSNPAYTYTHAKMLIIDGATLYVLTSNLSQSGLGGSSFTRNREFGVVDTHAEDVAEAQAIFDADWNHTRPALHDRNMVVSPVNARSKVLAFIGLARTALQVEGEEMYDSASEDALIAAARRGVSVRLVLPDASAIAAADVARLKVGGVQLGYLSAPYIHAKVIVADGRLAFVGSENFSVTSLDQNREVGLLVADTAALATIASTFERDWVVATPA